MTRKLSFNQSSKYPFDLDKVLYAGQDFRWQPRMDNWHSGVLAGNLIHIRQNANVLEYKSHTGSDLDDILRCYFRLDVDIDEIYDDISRRDDKIKVLTSRYPWLRVLRQPDPWECMVAYICSARAGVPKIANNVEAISQRLGAPVRLEDDYRHTFPSPSRVLKAGVEPLVELRLGFSRLPPFIIRAARRISCREVDLTEMARGPYARTIPKLMEEHSASRKAANGISIKVANCIALFTLDMTMAFPVDRHVWNAVRLHFPAFQHRDEPTDGQKKKIIRWAQDRFQEHAGHANQLGIISQSKQSRA